MKEGWKKNRKGGQEVVKWKEENGINEKKEETIRMEKKENKMLGEGMKK
jgi:hypothetical protein